MNLLKLLTAVLFGIGIECYNLPVDKMEVVCGSVDTVATIPIHSELDIMPSDSFDKFSSK